MRDRDLLADPPAEQLVDGDAESLALDVVEGLVQRCLRVRVALDGYIHPLMGSFEVEGVAALEGGSKCRLDEPNRQWRRLAEITAVIAAPFLEDRCFPEPLDSARQ